MSRSGTRRQFPQWGALCRELVSEKPPFADVALSLASCAPDHIENLVDRGREFGETNPTEFAANVQANGRRAVPVARRLSPSGPRGEYAAAPPQRFRHGLARSGC